MFSHLFLLFLYINYFFTLFFLYCLIKCCLREVVDVSILETEENLITHSPTNDKTLNVFCDNQHRPIPDTKVLNYNILSNKFITAVLSSLLEEFSQKTATTRK
jgi:hypothetical protein